MGIYYKPVNIDKKQQVHPHKVGDGLKYQEWVVRINSGTHKTIRQLLDEGVWSENDEIRVVSDAGINEYFHLHGPQTGRKVDYDDDWEDAHNLVDRSKQWSSTNSVS